MYRKQRIEEKAANHAIMLFGTSPKSSHYERRAREIVIDLLIQHVSAKPQPRYLASSMPICTIARQRAPALAR